MMAETTYFMTGALGQIENASQSASYLLKYDGGYLPKGLS